jgi:hypothetical protein
MERETERRDVKKERYCRRLIGEAARNGSFWPTLASSPRVIYHAVLMMGMSDKCVPSDNRLPAESARFFDLTPGIGQPLINQLFQQVPVAVRVPLSFEAKQRDRSQSSLLREFLYFSSMSGHFLPIACNIFLPRNSPVLPNLQQVHAWCQATEPSRQCQPLFGEAARPILGHKYSFSVRLVSRIIH